MATNDIFKRDLSGEMVSPNDPGYDELINDIFATMKKATEMNTGYRTPEEVHEFMGEILGKPLPKSTTMLPPFYIDYGKPVTIGEDCFIQQCCTFFGRCGITIGNGVFIGPKSTSSPSITTKTLRTVAPPTDGLSFWKTRCGWVSTSPYCLVFASATAVSWVPTAW